MSSYIIGKIDIDNDKLKKDLQIHDNFPKIAEEYDEFGTGFWQNCSLWNATDNKNDTMYRDYDHAAQQTEYGKKLTYVDELLKNNFKFDNLKMVRTRNLIDGMVIPHKDFVELNKPKQQYFRVFVPLEDNELAFHSDEESVFKMRKGEVWFLDAAIIHAAVNFFNNSRIFLCLDYVFPGDYSPEDIFANKSNYNPELSPFIVSRQDVEADFEESVIKSLSKIISQHTFKDIVFMLSKLHFYKNLPITTCYDMLVSIAEASQDEAVYEKAIALRKYLIEKRDLRERFSLAQWPTPLKA
ncbi:aspartyl/asparaginyl beta-hydroxylase domain-containing protein [Halalkalibacter urbisdiaboli]|uniref:aspartyl/asparaginyl beta-hydroxylase domain-containing protein n=1 Tax=Halalkalibacter urbisdiaboli TaxID=1960589 RepID=UPI000B441B5D|nr:aspartyl/asparaginyl beta-hydroxylase domain-containing protein [Halalkalibacter urbisdiaboli]